MDRSCLALSCLAWIFVVLRWVVLSCRIVLPCFLFCIVLLKSCLVLSCFVLPCFALSSLVVHCGCLVWSCGYLIVSRPALPCLVSPCRGSLYLLLSGILQYNGGNNNPTLYLYPPPSYHWVSLQFESLQGIQSCHLLTDFWTEEKERVARMETVHY